MLADEEVEATGSTVTVELRCGNRFLLVRRPYGDNHFPGYWAFPGGRVQAGESFISAAERECKEETGAALTGRLYFVDSYPLEGTTRTGIHYTFEMSNDQVTVEDFPEHKWVSSVEEMQKLEPRIAGIDNHAEYSARRLSDARMLTEALDRLEELQRQADHLEAVNVSQVRGALDRLTWFEPGRSSSDQARLLQS